MILLLYILLTLYWFSINKSNERSVLKYVNVTAFALFLLSGLRNMAIYNDTLGYVTNFEYLGDMSIQDIMLRWPKDTFFYVTFHYLHPILLHNYTLMLLLISGIYMFPLYTLIKRYSPLPLYSWWAFAFVGLLMFTMAGLRQTIALGLTLFGFLCLLQDKKKYFFACVALAYLYHGTAIIFLVVFVLNRLQFKFNRATVLSYFVIVAIVMFMGNTILKDALDFLGQSDERYIGYGDNMQGSNYTYALQQLLLTLPSLYLLRRRLTEPLVSLFAHIAVLALIFVLLSPVVAEMFRVSMYFSWSLLILFPMAMKELGNRSNLPVLYLLFFVFYLVFINKTLTNEYYFWFQDASDYIRRVHTWY